MDQDKLIAYHEAGHIVVALLLNQDIDYVDLDADPPHTEHAARTLYTPRNFMQPNRAAVLRIQGGRFGAALLDAKYITYGVEDDDRLAHLAYDAYRTSPEYGGETLLEITEEVGWLVKCLAATVENLAKALQKKRRMTGEEVKAEVGPLVYPSPYRWDAPWRRRRER